MKQIFLREDVACEVHKTLAGESTRLAEVLAESNGETAPVEWRVIVTPRTVLRIEGIFLLAASVGCTVRFEPAPHQTPRQRAFLEDFLRHQLEGESALARTLGQAKEWCSLLGECTRVITRLGALRSPVGLPCPSRLESAVLIGMYGGGHIGDAAILGGVLLHLHETYGTRQATVLSRRPEHTRELVAGLYTPVELSVLPYETSQVDRLLRKSDALVLAGGPFGGWPRLLAKHLVATLSAKRQRKPVLIERIGVTHFRSKSSQKMARCVARLADHISVRASASVTHPVLANLDAEFVRDAAFDYGASRRTLDLLRSSERDSIDELLRNTEGRLRVGVNVKLRQRRSARTDSIESRFLKGLAEALVRFAREARQSVSYVYFPLNSTQFGRSDLQEAYRLHRLIGAAADFRVWEADPDIDGLLYLVRQLQLAVTMRFHAGVFVLGQNIPAIGIDSRPGEGGKVTQLFFDSGYAKDVRTTEAFDADWLVRRLHQHTSSPSASGPSAPD